MARNDFMKLLNNLDMAAASLILTGPTVASEKIVADLQERGPAWTGRFSNSWQIDGPQGQTAKGNGQEGQAQAVKLPGLLFTGPQAARVLLRQFAAKDKVVFRISNFSEYADEARDLVPFNPEKPMTDNLKPIVKTGKRSPGGRRGDLQGSGKNRITAPLDWYSTYVGGGFIDKVIQVSMDGIMRGLK
jgi:hypothetical protein